MLFRCIRQHESHACPVKNRPPDAGGVFLNRISEHMGRFQSPPCFPNECMRPAPFLRRNRHAFSNICPVLNKKRKNRAAALSRRRHHLTVHSDKKYGGNFSIGNFFLLFRTQQKVKSKNDERKNSFCKLPNIGNKRVRQAEKTDQNIARETNHTPHLRTTAGRYDIKNRIAPPLRFFFRLDALICF